MEEPSEMESTAVPTMQSDSDNDGPVSSLAFEEVRTRQELAELSDGTESPLADILRTTLDDSADHDERRAYIGRNARGIVLVAPCMKQTLRLPVKLGEKVLWRIPLPSLRMLPAAQLGVRSQRDAQELLQWLRASRPKLAIVFTDLMTDTPLHAAVAEAQALGYRVTNNEAAPHLFHTFKASYEEFFREKSSKYKNQLRKKEKVFRERFGSAYVIKEYRKAADVQEFLDAADLINKKTYQYKLFGEAVDNGPESTQRYCRLANEGAFRSFVLWHEAIPLCFILGRQGRDGVFQHQITGYDPDWREYAPGINCNILMLQKLYESDRPVVLDFGSGDADYKRLFTNTQKLSASPILIPRNFGYAFAFLIHRSSVRFNELAVAALVRIGAKDRIKRLLRRLP